MISTNFSHAQYYLKRALNEEQENADKFDGLLQDPNPAQK
jgi:hypothetical protein